MKRVRIMLIALVLMPLMALASSLYMVIDLSEEVSAEKYPVTYLDDVPAGGWTDDYKTTKLVMRRIEPGTYMMGSPDDELGHSSGSETLHQVTLTEAFYVGVFEITQRQWELVMGTRPSYFNNASYYATRPVEQTTYTMIRGNSKGAQWPHNDEVDDDSFIGRLRSKADLRFDLPTEAQWEYACRAGTTTALNSGKNLTDKGCCANMSEVGRYYYNGGYSYSASCTTDYGTAKVGSYLPNSWGLYDMHGNVWEYCLDRYCPHINCSHLVASTNPVGNTIGTYTDINTSRIARGGSWNWDAHDSRSAQRYAVSAPFEISNNNFIGLRLALTIADNSTRETITYNPGSIGSGSLQTVTKNHGVSLILLGAIFTRTGYTQTGWSTTDGGSQVYELGAYYTDDAAITLYPVWTSNTLQDGGPYTEVVDGIAWTFMVQNGEASVGTGSWDGTAVPKSTSGDISIPPILGGRTVTMIGVDAFDYCEKLTSVFVPACVESIGQNGLLGCSALTNVTISGVKSISYAAFWYCNSLACVSIPASVTNVACSAFGRCRALERFCVADDSAFYSSLGGVLFNRSKTKLVTYSAAKKGAYDVPVGVTEIGVSAFDECSGLTAVTLPFGVTKIDANAFMGCTGLTSIDIPSSVTYIGPSAFAGCDGFSEITIPSAVTSIGQYAFFGCSQLEAIEVSDANTSFTAVDGVLFNKSMTRLITCPAKKTGSYTIPAGVKSLDWCAFFECRELDSIIIPSSVMDLGLCPFRYCSGLNSVDFEGAPPEGLSDSELEADVAIRYNAAYADEWAQAIAECGFTNATPYTPQKPDGGPYTEVVDGVEWTFMVQDGEACVGTGVYGETAVSKLIVGGLIVPAVLGGRTVTKVAERAFAYCDLLTSVEMSASVAHVGDSAFFDCEDLTNVLLSASVTNIGNSAFMHCRSLTSIVIPSSVKKIENYAFDYCSSLLTIDVDPQNESYSSVDGLLLSKDERILYAGVNGDVIIPSSVTDIAECAFAGHSRLLSVEIPSSVTNMGFEAFVSCAGLTSVTIPASVLSIGDGSFHYCNSMISFAVDGDNPNYKSENRLLLSKDGETLYAGVNGNVTIPSGVKSIGNTAFSGRYGLLSVEIPPSVTSIGGQAFDGCHMLTSVSIPSSVTNIGFIAFCYCAGLTNVIIPASVTSIGSGAFHCCSGLESITIGCGVNRIEDGAFYGCDAIDAVDFEGAPPEELVNAGLNQDAVIRYNVVYEEEWLPVIAECGFTNATPYTPQKPDGGPYTEVVDGVEWTFMVADGEASVGTGEYGGTAVEASLAGGIAIPSILGGRTVTGIGDNAFRECYDLTEISIPDSVVSIGDHAFYNCDSILRIEIPQDVSYIGSDPFGSCVSLSEIAVSEYNQWFSSNDGVMFSKDGTELIRCPCGKVNSYVIPSSVISIGWCAFEDCVELSVVTIPSKVTYIGGFAFDGCTGITDMIIPPSVAYVGSAAFQGCANLANVVISTNLTSTSYYLFANCTGLKRVTIPQGVTSIGEYSFGGCSSLETVSIPSSVTGIATNAFGYSPVREVHVGIGEANRVGGLLAESGMDLQDVAFVEPSNRIEYRETRGAENNNPTNVWISTGIVFDPLPDVTGWEFAGWSPAEVPAGHVGDVVVTAQWVAVGTTPPDWRGVTKGDTMTVYAAVSNRQTKACIEAAGSLLAAFDQTGECRGVTEIEEGPFGSFFQLSVGIESTAETGFMLKVWDAATGQITEIATKFDANPDKVLGAFDDLIVYEIGQMTQTVTLNEGWMWISFSLLPDDSTVGTLFAGLTFANGDMIKASNKTITYYNGVWYPSAYSLTPGKAYMVRKSSGGDAALDITGVPMSDGLAFEAGWNWFGPTTLATQKVSSVTHTGGFVNKDMVKSSSKTATWYGGKWYSADFQLCPGCGYVAKFANAGTIYFGEAPAVASAQTSAASLPLCASRMTLAEIGNGKPLWKEVTKGDNMTVYASVHNLTADANIVSDGSLLAAFDANGECRGVAAVEDGPCGKVFQLTVGLESTDEKGFVLKIWDAASENVYDIIEKFDANAQRQIGEINEPIVYTTQDASALIPDLGENPTTEEITNVFVEAKAEDPKLAEKITNETEYVAFREWSGKVKPQGGGDAVGAAGVMAAPNAWVSYALGSETLLEAAPTDADLTVETFEPKSGEDGKFDFTVSVKDVEVGGAATTEAQKEQVKENLKQVFGLEGGSSLEEGEMKAANVDITFGTPVDGKVKFTAGPKDTDAKTFFMKVKVK